MRLEFKKKTSHKEISRRKKKIRIRKDIFGTTERPRLSVFRSLHSLSAQVIDDTTGKTLAASTTSTLASLKSKTSVEAGKELGKDIAKKIMSTKITNIVFDRNGYQYHGRIKAIAEGAREAGLKF